MYLFAFFFLFNSKKTQKTLKIQILVLWQSKKILFKKLTQEQWHLKRKQFWHTIFEKHFFLKIAW